MSDEERVMLTKEQAIAMLPDGEYIHTFRQVGMMILGTDWTREEMLTLIDHSEFELSGPQATAMGHGMAAQTDRGWLFVQTKVEETK